MKLASLFRTEDTERLLSAIEGDIHALLIHSPQTKADIALANLIAEMTASMNINVMPVRPLEGDASIKIASARDLVHLSSMRDNKQTLVVISPAGLLTVEAQNSLLKTLEQPSRSVRFILIAEPDQMLATIVSRMQTLSVRTVASDKLADVLKLSPKDKGLSVAYGHDLDRLHQISTDKTQLIAARQQVDLAKSIVSGKAEVGDLFAQDKTILSQLISLCMAITALQLNKADNETIRRLRSQFNTLGRCQKLLDTNVNPKLVATKLAML